MYSFFTPQASKARWNLEDLFEIPSVKMHINQLPMLESKKPNTPSLKVKTNYIKFDIIFSSNTLLCNYFPNNKRTIQICNYCLQLIWMQLEVGRWIRLWKCVCSAVSLWYTRRFEQINACTKPSGKEEKNTGREEKKRGNSGTYH